MLIQTIFGLLGEISVKMIKFYSKFGYSGKLWVDRTIFSGLFTSHFIDLMTRESPRVIESDSGLESPNFVTSQMTRDSSCKDRDP